MPPIALDVADSPIEHGPRPTKPLTPLEAMGHGGRPVHVIPKFASFAEKRLWTLEHLAGAFRVFGREKYAEGIAGHISVRDPEFSDRFWINPLGTHFSMMKVSDLICLDMQGNVVDGNRVSFSNRSVIMVPVLILVLLVSPSQQMLQASRYILLAIWPVLTYTLYVMLTHYTAKHGLPLAASLK